MFSYLVRRSHKRRGLQIYKRWNPWPSLSQVLSCNLKMGRKCGGCGGGRRGQCRLKMQLVESYRSPSPFPLSFDRSQPVCLDLRSCMGNQACGIRNPGKFCSWMWNPGFWNPELPTNDLARVQVSLTKFGIHYLESGIQDSLGGGETTGLDWPTMNKNTNLTHRSDSG